MPRRHNKHQFVTPVRQSLQACGAIGGIADPSVSRTFLHCPDDLGAQVLFMANFDFCMLANKRSQILG